MSLGHLQRLAAITGTPAPHNKARALMEGLVALAKHTTTQVRVIVQLISVWEAWTQEKHRGPFLDQLEQITAHDYQRVTVLYVARNTKSPQAPGSEPQLRRRQRDAALAAWERAKTFQNSRNTDWQKVLDEDHKLIYQHAINRLAVIFNSKDHYIHQKANRHQGKHTKQYKKQLIAQCKHSWQAPSHRWMAHRSGYQCGACGVRVHQGLTVQALEEHLHAECPQLSLEDRLPEPEQPHQPLPRKQTRQQVIKQILQQQHEQPPPQQQHIFEETTGYLRCVKCGANVHKRSNEQLFQAFVQGQCVDQPYTAPHEGHRSHALWQKGTKVTCTQCGLSLHLDAHQRLILTAAVKKPCKGAGTGSPPWKSFSEGRLHKHHHRALRTLQVAAVNSVSIHHRQDQSLPRSHAYSSSSLLRHQSPTSRVPGRHQHFSTQLDQQAQGSLATSPEQAMIPSPKDPLSRMPNQNRPESARGSEP